MRRTPVLWSRTPVQRAAAMSLPADPICPATGGLSAYAAALRAGTTSAEAATRDYLARIEALDGTFGAFQYVDAEGALSTAQEVDARLAAGDDLGPLMGVPIGVKDLCEVEGMPLTAGSALDADVLHSIVGAEGSLVSALKAAGCVILGKTKTTEWAFSPTGINRTKGTPMNPADAAVSRLPGGSSAGSAVATAAGLAAFAIGSDTGGSVRVPSALCGVVGIKTTIGLPGWGTDGVFQLSSTFDTMGPLAKSAADVALVLSALGEPTQPAPVPEPTSLRIGRATNAVLWEGCDEHVLRSVERALELLKAAGATVVDVELPCVGEVDRAAILPTELLDFIGAEQFEAIKDDVDSTVAGRTATGLTMPRERYEAAVAGQLEVAAVAAKALAEFGCDAIAFPTVPVVAPETEVAMSASAEEDLALVGLLLRNNVVGNDLGVCAASLPVQHLDMEAPGALPVGLQLMGAALTDEVLMAAVCAVEGVVGQPTTPSPSL